MFKSQFGNNYLYLLSEKKRLTWFQSKKYTHILKKRNDRSNQKKFYIAKNTIKNLSSANRKQEENEANNSYWHYSIMKDISSFGYVDIGENKGETIVQIAPPMLVELPFILPSFLLTGARSPKFLETIKNALKSCSEISIKKQTDLPDTIIIEPENKTSLMKCLERTLFQGNRLSSYIKISDYPVAWDMLEFSEDLQSYNESLNPHWFSGNKSDIQKIFDMDTLKFKSFQLGRDTLEKELSLIEVIHHESFSKHYLFSKRENKMVKVNVDWGKFLIAGQSGHSILKYNRRNFELSSSLRIPGILERGLVFCSGTLPIETNAIVCKKETKEIRRKRENVFIFKSIPYKIAKLISDKLGKKLNEI